MTETGIQVVPYIYLPQTLHLHTEARTEFCTQTHTHLVKQQTQRPLCVPCILSQAVCTLAHKQSHWLGRVACTLPCKGTHGSCLAASRHAVEQNTPVCIRMCVCACVRVCVCVPTHMNACHVSCVRLKCLHLFTVLSQRGPSEALNRGTFEM
jgi:hypothetical protein